MKQIIHNGMVHVGALLASLILTSCNQKTEEKEGAPSAVVKTFKAQDSSAADTLVFHTPTIDPKGNTQEALPADSSIQ